MLKSKRSKSESKKNTKKKSTKNQKLPVKNLDLNEEDEEIMSESSVDSQEIDKKLKKKTGGQDKNQAEAAVQPEFTKKGLSNDERRLLLAKSIISTIEKDNEDEDILESEIRKAKGDHCNEKAKFIKLTKVNDESIYVENVHQNYTESIDHSFVRCHLSGITSLNFIDEHTLLTTSKDKRSFLIDVVTEKKTLLPSFTDKPILSAAVCRNKKNIIFGGADRKIYVFNLETNKVLSVHAKAHTDCITGVKVDPELEQVYSISKDNTFKVWALSDYNNLIHMETFYGHTSPGTDLDVLSTNRVVSCGEDANVHQWKIDTQSFLQYKQGETQYDCISAANKNYFYTGDYNSGLKLFSISKKKHIAEAINNSYNFSKKKEIDSSFHFPVTSLLSFRDSDLMLSGTVGGIINVYGANYTKSINKINLIGSIKLHDKGIVSAIANNSKIIACAYSKDAKNGRWDVDESIRHSGIAIARVFE